jgi:hypothetical protein
MNAYGIQYMLLPAVLLGLLGTSVAGTATTGNGPESVDLGTVETFAVLSKVGITNMYQSSMVGDVGASPITGAAVLLTCGEISGSVYTVDGSGPLPCLTTDATLWTWAVSDMELAYNDAAG